MCTSVVNNYFIGDQGPRGCGGHGPRGPRGFGGHGPQGPRGCGRNMPPIFDHCCGNRQSTKAENTTSIFNGVIGILGTVLNPMSAMTGSMLSW